MLISSRNTVIDTPRNNVLRAIWVSLSPIKLTHRINQHNKQNQDCPQGHFGNMTYLCHSSWLRATGLQWLGSRAAWLLAMHGVFSYLASLSNILEDIPVHEKPVYNVLSLETNSTIRYKNIFPLFYYTVKFSEMQLPCKLRKDYTLLCFIFYEALFTLVTNHATDD